ncbi:MAG: capsular biosynthesis protein [Myxococcales bacterium FL481]|nr:MAG: capsular biosynthesis protein [Myxococcales bacterium FL481]
MLSWLGWSRRKQDSQGEAPLELRPRDCHSHVIPGVDDGSRNLPESLEMLALLQAAGVERIIATPHIFPARFPNEPEPLRVAFDELRAAAATSGLSVELELGAEHYLDDTLLERIANERVICFGPERYVLFETFTGAEVPAGLFEVCAALGQRGYTPLMAHVERYGYLRGSAGRELVEDLRCAGVRFQVNRTVGRANLPGVGPRGTFIAWLRRRGYIDEVGSDLHRPTADGRPVEPAA